MPPRHYGRIFFLPVVSLCIGVRWNCPLVLGHYTFLIIHRGFSRSWMFFGCSFHRGFIRSWKFLCFSFHRGFIRSWTFGSRTDALRFLTRVCLTEVFRLSTFLFCLTDLSDHQHLGVIRIYPIINICFIFVIRIYPIINIWVSYGFIRSSTLVLFCHTDSSDHRHFGWELPL